MNYKEAIDHILQGGKVSRPCWPRHYLSNSSQGLMLSCFHPKSREVLFLDRWNPSQHETAILATDWFVYVT